MVGITRIARLIVVVKIYTVAKMTCLYTVRIKGYKPPGKSLNVLEF